MTSPWPVLRLVDAPEHGARVLFDFRDPQWNQLTGHRIFPTSRLELGGPSQTGPIDALGNGWGPRQIRVPLVVQGTQRNAVGVISRLSRVLVQERVYLEWCIADGVPTVWFAVTPGEPRLDFEHAINDGMTYWRIDPTFSAAPWAVGEWQRHDLGTLSNDPGTDLCTVDLPTIHGDVATPLTVKLTPGALWDYGRQVMLAAVASTPARDAEPLWFGPDELVAAEGAGPLTASAEWPGGAYREVPVTDPGGSEPRVFLQQHDGLPAARYMMLARVGQVPGEGNAVEFDLSTTFDATDRERIERAWNGRQWARVGEFSHPAGVPFEALAADAITSPYTGGAWARRVSAPGAAGARFGGMLLVPIDGPGIVAASVLWSKPGFNVGPSVGLPDVVEWNGTSRAVLTRFDGPDGAVFPAIDNRTDGSWVMGVPDAVNRLTVLTKTDRNGGTDLPTETTGIEVSYRPRVLWFANPDPEELWT